MADMKTVAVESGKGGSGKTTTTLNLAVAAGLGGKTVVVIDLDAGQLAGLRRQQATRNLFGSGDIHVAGKPVKRPQPR